MAPSSVATESSTMSPCCRYFGLFAWRLKNAFHLTAGGSSEAMITGFGGAPSAVPDRRAGHHEIASAQTLEPRKCLQCLQRLVDHIAVDEHVLPQFAADPQTQAQIAESLELVGVEQHQGRADRGERWIRLGLVELGFRQLDVAGRHVVGRPPGQR